ncbi:MAG: atpC [Candidatus Kaiserbacteria bacterium]|nr:atpC [Candidatus Kaiserbacteria bacterium]
MSADTSESATLHVQVLSPKGIVWEGEAQSVSSVNSQGPFDLLPQHAHFISLVEKKPIVVVDVSGKESTLSYDTAVVRLFDDVVTIYADIS